jgi:hypothetical protein
VREKHLEERLAKEMHVIFLHIERPYRPGVRFADTTEFLLHKGREFPNQNLFAVCGSPDKVIGSLVGDMCGVLCIHTRRYTLCSNSCEVPVGGRLTLR